MGSNPVCSNFSPFCEGKTFSDFAGFLAAKPQWPWTSLKQSTSLRGDVTGSPSTVSVGKAEVLEL